jgi:molecular chaperone GrpE (heat shock protein)
MRRWRRRRADAPSKTVAELIRARDIAQMASASGEPVPAATLAVLDRALVRIIEREGVRVLDGRGRFDPSVHEALEVRPTSDPAQHETVCAVIRPGYAFGGRVLRPQQVAVYRSER